MSVTIRNHIRFYLNERLVSLESVPPDLTLLDYLRLQTRLTGTKEGCAEGDCGACTVLVGSLRRGGLVYETVNACIRFVGSLDGCHVVTVEYLRGAEGGLHPVQQAMVEHHGSQCGFCTPGIVMSLYDLWLGRSDAAPAAVEKALQGNLCRCTGYQSILDAASAAASVENTADPLIAGFSDMTKKLETLRDGARIDIQTFSGRVLNPASLDDFAALLQDYPEATIIAGATDVGLWVTKAMRPISPAVFIGNLVALQGLDSSADGLTIGAGVTYSEAFDAIVKHCPPLGPLWDRIGGEQVRNMGTIGGNIANGSPIGDTPPPLIALDSKLTLRCGGEVRTIALEDFFIGYGKQDLKPGEFVLSVQIPPVGENTRFAVYKISKRRDEDISALCGAFNLTLGSNGEVVSVRIAYGGMAATPKRATSVEKALIGKSWSLETVESAMKEFANDYRPLTDWRASADYRLLAASNLLKRFYLETSGEIVQIERYPHQAAVA